MALGEILSSSFERVGFYTLAYPEYPSRIRGGDNNVQIVVSERPDIALSQKVDILFVMNENLANLHKNEVSLGGIILKSGELGIDKIAEDLGNPLVKNIAAAGAIWRLCGQKPEILFAQIELSLGKKNLKANMEAAKAGFNLGLKAEKIKIKPSRDKIIGASGNEIFAKAIIASGCSYASIYPMTPITSLLQALSKTDLKMITPEDEIFAALSTLGASYAGTRALTATSGGGFCLMGEAVGFASMAEIPLVIILGQRTGPSSGIPTYSSQADLNQAIFSTHGEAEKIVLAPGDLKEVLLLTQEAFNLADKYQLPVIILTDKYLSETHFSISKKILDQVKVKIDRGARFKKGALYSRYEITKDGISPRAIPGETAFLTNSYEHDEFGFSTDDTKTRDMMVAKRSKKLADLKSGFEIMGDRKSATAIIGWGSTKTLLQEFILNNPRFKYIHIWRPWPFSKELQKELSKASKIIVVENNSTGQMAKLIERQVLVKTTSILKDDGRPFFKDELAQLIRNKS